MENTKAPSPINHRKLRSRRSYLGLKNAQIAAAAGTCVVTVSRYLNGDDGVTPEIRERIASALQMRRYEDFEPVRIDQGFAESLESSARFSIRWDAARSTWIVIQESALCERAVGEFYGAESERLAAFVADQLNAAIK